MIDDIHFGLLLLGSFWILSWAIQLFFYLFFFLRLSRKNQLISHQYSPPVSVIICARNEEENLERFLPKILTQDYPHYEVIVVNDASEDNSDVVLKRFSHQYPHLKISTIKKDDKFTHNKKLALTIGIKAAQNDILLLTDADCYPENDQWIRSMVSSYNENTDIVLGYGGYQKTGGLLNKLIRFDSLFIATQYFSFALAGIPYMGVGRNLSYKKSLFFKNKGFASHLDLTSGDDDLFINENATAKNTAVNMIAHTRSVPRKSLVAWILQKKRHQSTFYRYKLKHKILLTLEPLSRWMFYLLIPLIILANNNLWFPVIILFLVRLIIQYIVYYFSTKTLNEKDLLLFSPVFDFIHLLIDLIIKMSKNPYRKITWK
ncbi:MAG: glycosyltransferase [Bacteroidales bacterium]|nr:glycosyltransferase [Bacteroidales bacterium]